MICAACDQGTMRSMIAVSDVRFGTSSHTFPVVRCPSCGLASTHFEAGAINPEDAYPDEYGAFQVRALPNLGSNARGVRRTIDCLLRDRLGVVTRRLSALETIGLDRDSTVLDVGCGAGENGAAVARRYGCDVVGVEPSAEAAEAARKNGLDVFEGPFESFSTERRFTGAILVHCLEHLADPLSTLRRVHDLLVPGGSLFIAVPNLDGLERRLFGEHWDAWDIPRHLHHFSPPSLRQLVGAAGFRVEAQYFEAYSLASRSLANRRHPSLPYAERNRRPLPRTVESLWGLGLGLLHLSSAISIVATKKG